MRSTPPKAFTLFVIGCIALGLLYRHHEPETHFSRCDPGCLYDKAHKTFHTKLARQSKSIPEARKQYLIRYKRQPPPHFNIWVDFALQHKSPIIDDYDQIDRDLQPFRKMGISKQAWKQRMSLLKHSEPGEMLGSLNIVEGYPISMGPQVGTMSSQTLEELVKPFAQLVPDVSVLYNWYAEPRILAPTKKTSSSTPQILANEAPQFANLTGQSTKAVLMASCPYSSLVTDRLRGNTHMRDLCKEANTLQQDHTHGFFESPDNFQPTSFLIPLLSRAKLSTFMDILAPNICYGHTDYRIWHQNDSIPFSEKVQDLYWRGTTSGIAMTKQNWIFGHRHRLVHYTQLLRKSIEHDQSGDRNSNSFGNEIRIPTQGEAREALQRLSPAIFNVGFSSSTPLCDPEVCSVIRTELPFKDFHRNQESFQHQFVLDIDGQSMSCRFYSLLGSGSVVFKQTIWAEWHDDRIIPWLHYVPIETDLSKHDIPLLLDWFVNSEKGQTYAAKIAIQSRAWSDQSLRQIDISIYLFRILVELADIL